MGGNNKPQIQLAEDDYFPKHFKQNIDFHKIFYYNQN